jgi:hypothetical protein
MFEKFLSENAQDFRQRYEGTYGYFFDRSAGKRVLCRIDRIDLDSPTRMVYFSDHRSVEFSIRADVEGDIGFEFIPPRSAFYNTQKGVFYVQRVAARQFSRGIRDSNTNIFKLEGDWRRVATRFDSLLPIFEQRIPYGINNVKDTPISKVTAALSPSFCLNVGSLYVFTERVGRVVDSKVRLYQNGNLFVPELERALENCQMSSYKVEVAK